MLTTTPRPKTCRCCKAKFTPVRPMQVACGVLCGLEIGRKKAQAEREKEDRSTTKVRKAALKTIPDLIKEAQREFNRFVRLRDSLEACISCGAAPPDLSGLHAGRDAGHYRSVGSASHLRFDERNCHGQCVHCNQWKSGNAVDYRLGLVARIGLAAVESLECDNTTHKWTRDELIAIKATYAAKTRALKKEQA